MRAPTVLAIDDEPSILEVVTEYLRQAGYQVHSAVDGPSGLRAARALKPDVVVLDVMLPGMDGLELLAQLRRESTAYVIMLSARSEETDKIIGLSVGADDYLAKPFSFRELLARIRSILRRIELDRQTSQFQPMTIGNLTLDPIARRVFRGGQELQLSAREFDLLSILMRNAGRALSREELLSLVWGEDWIGDPRTLDVHVRWLRLKIEEDPAMPAYIQTVRGHGYRFAGPEELE